METSVEYFIEIIGKTCKTISEKIISQNKRQLNKTKETLENSNKLETEIDKYIF